MHFSAHKKSSYCSDIFKVQKKFQHYINWRLLAISYFVILTLKPIIINRVKARYNIGANMMMRPALREIFYIGLR
jgi:hypothetical protein